ncbi:MAG: alpha/beta fold hydrolase [Burkholderiaceae bacterium]|jgi:pimeloyl-ACP methyl ester carboxylesterase|nr:alpha/beta fold hydrolase [Burkholderiaceae bacterium]
MTATQIQANGIPIAVEDTHPADAARPAILLIMGLGGQLIHWPPVFVRPLVDAGFRVIRMDNRDAGLSRHFSECGKPNLFWTGVRLALGIKPRLPYTLSDMAQDAIGVLDALGIQRAHVAGASMGGMIAQRVALAAPGRVITLSSIMSSSGARGLPGPDPKVLKAMFKKPRGTDPEALARYCVDFFRAVGSPAHPQSPADLRAMVDASLARDSDPHASLRQMVAVLADTGRAALLQRIQCPTLVLHGVHDAFVPMACGQDTARRIPGARFVAIDGMGHDLAAGVCAQLLPHLIAFLQTHA